MVKRLCDVGPGGMHVQGHFLEHRGQEQHKPHSSGLIPGFPKHWLSKDCTAEGEGCWDRFAYSDVEGPAAHTLPSCSQAESTLGTGSWGLAQMLCGGKEGQPAPQESPSQHGLREKTQGLVWMDRAPVFPVCHIRNEAQAEPTPAFSTAE